MEEILAIIKNLKEEVQNLEVRLKEYEKERGVINISSVSSSDDSADVQALGVSTAKDSNKSRRRRNKENKTDKTDILYDDGSTEDDNVNQDPNWETMRLYRVKYRKLRNKLKVHRLAFEKASNENLTKCACTTKYATKKCICRKNGMICINPLRSY